MVDRRLFAKAQRKIAEAKTPEEHRMIEQRGAVTARIHGRTYRLTWSIRRIKA